MVKRVLFFIFTLAIHSGALHAQDDIDYIGLAKTLIRDGNFSRAEKTLNKISEEDDVQQDELYALQGMILLNKKKYKEAKKKFSKSLEEGQKNSEIFLYLAEANLQLGNLTEALRNLNRVRGLWLKKISYFVLKAEIFWKMGEKIKAWEVLGAAESLGLAPFVIAKKKFTYFIQEGLFQASHDLAVKLFKKGLNKSDLVAMAGQWRQQKQYDLAISTLQMALLKWPRDSQVTLELAQNYLMKNEKLSVALLLEESARTHPELRFEAAEVLRQVGLSYRARHLNLGTLDPEKKLRQKVALFLEEDNYSSLTALLPALQREKMLEDENILYAVAFSLFQTGDFRKSQNFLNQITSNELFEKAVELRKEIEKCQLNSWSCVETI